MTAFLSLFGASPRAVRLYRVALATLVACDIADKWPTLEWLFSDSGALPRSASIPLVSDGEGWLVWLVCAHAWHGSLLWVQCVALTQLFAAAALAADVYPFASNLMCWWLHCSWCLRNASLVYIFDRYLHLLLFYSLFLPTAPAEGKVGRDSAVPIASVAATVLALQLLVIYFDAGFAKWSDPAMAWSVRAPVAALDTYLRHTRAARLAHALLARVDGLRLAGAATVAVELLAPPLALLVARSVSLRRVCLGALVGLHGGIALCMRNTQLLSAAALVAWLPFIDSPASSPSLSRPPLATKLAIVRPAVLLSFVALVLHYQWRGGEGVGCGGRASPDALQRLLLHNRWDVFASAEDYVVWEIAPARLSDGSIVDIWRDDEQIAWSVPTGPEPPRRRGRWRAFPYTAEREAAAESAFWGSLCDEWERHDAKGRTVQGFQFYMMQADTIPAEAQTADSGEYGQVRKRLIRSFDCRRR